MNILLIWTNWYVMVVIMFIILQNFLIAVITNTYRKVISVQKQISYKDKADLNAEYNILLSTFKNLDEYKVMVFSISKMDDTEEGSESVMLSKAGSVTKQIDIDLDQR